ncbi:hypothetical protein L5515_018155 [Caenorhabditis briggsae]|uniref:Uncharacterized protein n=1 Tax=Caenorhabditis briggsae TaxID=6238 RepID=A0AAE9JTQ7_CAEBR|nr:hypothetical protein L5515_018155 [Caenorhabditis briggsae]
MRPFRNRRHEQRHGQSATRCLALVFSVLTMIGSGFIIGFGFQTLVEVSFTASVIGNNEIIYGPYLLITIGILSFVMTPIGFYSIILNDKKVMVTHMFATFVLGVMCAVTAVLGYDLNSHVTSKEMETWMKTSIREDYGNPSAPYILTEWNKVQQQFKCCGAKNMNDFVKSKWFKMQKKHPKQRIPDSCCADCQAMHERFCVAFFKQPGDHPEKLLKNQTICIQASNRCLSADNSIANRDVCLQHSTDYRLSADAYRYTNGCLQPIRSTLEFFSFRIFIYSSALCVTLLLSTIVWLVVHEISSSPILPFRLIK